MEGVSLESGVRVQTVSLVIAVVALVSARGRSARTLRTLLTLELAVNCAQLYAYANVLRAERSPQARARLRYGDWWLTTPVMLLTAAMYMRRAELLEAADGDPCGAEVDLVPFVAAHRGRLALMLLANGAMLACGHAAEAGRLDRRAALALGTLAFLVAFGALWSFARHSRTGRWLFALLLPVWAGYGVAFALEPRARDAAFTALDLVSKNAFGLLLSLQALLLS